MENENIQMFILGLLTFFWGLILTIGLYKEIKEEFTKKEISVIFYGLMVNISLSFALAGLDIIFFE